MLFDSSVRKEMARNFGGTLVIMLTIVLTMLLIRTIGQAAKGAVSPNDVTLLLGYTVIAQLPMLLSLSLFVCGVSALTRMYRDSEMIIWFSSGARLLNFVVPALRMSWPVIAGMAVLVGLVRPWAQDQSATLRDRFERRSDLSRVAAGEFQTSRDGSRVFFVDRESQADTVGRDVFILSRQGEEESITTARTGHIVFEDNRRFLSLEDGQRTVVNETTRESVVSRFERSRVGVGEGELGTPRAQPAPARSTFDLLFDLDSPVSRGELVWRVGYVFATFNMVLLSIGLSAGNPRRAGSWNLIVALLAFVVYFNLLNLSQAWVAGQRFSAGGVLLGVHGGVLAAALVLLFKRDRGAMPVFARAAA